MTAAIFGLVGVIVGAVMQGGAAWLMERRREDWAARKAGRLLARALTRCRFVLKAGHDGAAPWGMIAVEINEALARWPEHSDLLAGTIKRDEDWYEIVGAVEALQRLEQRGHAGPLDAEVSADDREFLGYIAERSWAAAFTASMIGVVGVRAKPTGLVGRAWRWLRPQDAEAEMRRLVRYAYEADDEEPPPDESYT
ncbi:MAG: hypothetical protein WAU77_04505 [Solirubrobacteraceae bacterium]